MTVLVTAGPTRAYFDDVRYLSNYSSGALGFAICERLLGVGCHVIAVVGDTQQPFDQLPLKKLLRVETNREMRDGVMALSRKYRPEVGIFSAAVLDFEPVRQKGKVSSAQKEWIVRLKPAPKILDEAGEKFSSMVRVGFKLESKRRTASEIKKFGTDYLKRKKLDFLVYNQLSEVGPTGHKAIIFTKEGECVPAKNKKEIAKRLVALVHKVPTYYRASSR